MIKNISEKILSIAFQKMTSKFQRFPCMGADLPYMEMLANFNLFFSKTKYGNYFKRSHQQTSGLKKK